MTTTAVLIPAPGYYGYYLMTYPYSSDAERDRRWDILLGHDLRPGRQITKGELSTMLQSGIWTIRAKK